MLRFVRSGIMQSEVLANRITSPRLSTINEFAVSSLETLG